MAKKLKLMPLFQELKARAEISNRRPAPAGAGMFLMQLRAQNGSTTLPRRRLVISVKPGVTGSLPRPVKIIHSGPDDYAPSPGTRPKQDPMPAVPQVRPDAA